MTPTPPPARKSLEGQIVAVIVAVSGIAAGLNPSTFPPALAGTVATIVTIALMVQRLLLTKVVTADAASVRDSENIKTINAARVAIAAPSPEAIGNAVVNSLMALPDESTEYVTMFDDVTSSRIPSTAEAVGGYCDADFAGVWLEDVHRFPKLANTQRVVSIATRTSTTARIMDIESGDPTTPDEGAAWVKKMIAHGVYRPGIYVQLSTMPAVKAALERSGLRRDQYVLWVADWNGLSEAEKLLADGYDACQYTDHAVNSTDESLCKQAFFPPQTKPVPVPKPKPKPAPDLAKATVEFHWPSKQWHVVHDGDKICPEKSGRQASALLQMDTETGTWSIKALPWNYKA